MPGHILGHIGIVVRREEKKVCLIGLPFRLLVVLLVGGSIRVDL